MDFDDKKKSLYRSYKGCRDMLHAIQDEERSQRDTYKLLEEKLSAAPGYERPVLARQCNEILMNIENLVHDRNQMHGIVGKIAGSIAAMR